MRHVTKNGYLIQAGDWIARPIWNASTGPLDYIQIIDGRGRQITLGVSEQTVEFFEAVLELVKEIRGQE